MNISANLLNSQYIIDLSEAGIISVKQKDYYLSRIKAYQEYIAQRQKQVEVNSTVESQNKEEESRNVNSTTTTI